MPARYGERGSGLFGTISGLAVFFVLLSFAVQLLFNLYAGSVLTAAAHDAAHQVAATGLTDDRSPAAQELLASAESRARSLLGGYGERVEFQWELGSERVRLTISANHPRLAVHSIAEAFGLNRTVRTVEVRTELPR